MADKSLDKEIIEDIEEVNNKIKEHTERTRERLKESQRALHNSLTGAPIEFIRFVTRLNFGILAAVVGVLTVLESRPQPAEVLVDVLTPGSIAFMSSLSCVITYYVIIDLISSQKLSTGLPERIFPESDTIEGYRAKMQYDSEDKEGQNADSTEDTIEEVVDNIEGQLDDIQQMRDRMEDPIEVIKSGRKMVSRGLLVCIGATVITIISAMRIAYIIFA